jgi:hypothetical protein
MANKFTLKGDGVEVSYTIGATPGISALIYKDQKMSKEFEANEIHTDSTTLGSLDFCSVISVFLLGRPGSSGEGTCWRTGFSTTRTEELRAITSASGAVIGPNYEASMSNETCQRRAAASGSSA